MKSLKLKAIREDVPLVPYTTLGIGGRARFFCEVEEEKELFEVISWARKKKIPFIVIGSGSNLLVSEGGYEGLVIRDKVEGLRKRGRRIFVRGGTPLSDLVDFANWSGLSGLEKLTGIPGTVAGAIYGNAGAYGQTISDHLIHVSFFDGRKIVRFLKEECRFDYRESLFKKRKHLIILEAEFRLGEDNPQILAKASREILALRREKYPEGLKSPGSFFKNIVADRLPKKILKKIPPERIIYGKIPAGYLLEEVGAKGKRRGDIFIAEYHGNLFINRGKGKARDFIDLAREYQAKVAKRFGITLEPEVQLVGFEDVGANRVFARG